MIRAIIPLPTTQRESLSIPPALENRTDFHLPEVEWIDSPGSLLHPTPLGGSSDVLGLNLSRGCAHRCVFCSVRASAHYVGDKRIQLYRGLAERLDLELARMRKRPQAVFISPAMDPFPDLPEVQAETLRAVEVLAGYGIDAWLMTRGEIHETIRHELLRRRQHVKLTIGLTTSDAHIARITEPLTAAPQIRLRQIGQLRQQGLAVQAAVDPLLPGLTDTRENLEPLLEALAAEGVDQIMAGYLFLRESIAENLRQALEPHGWMEQILQAFRGGPILTAPGLAAARYLPRHRRQRGYATLMALAANHGISVTISRLTNPDFNAAPQHSAEERPRLRDLFLRGGKGEPPAVAP
jgi:DNA repair photolyase